MADEESPDDWWQKSRYSVGDGVPTSAAVLAIFGALWVLAGGVLSAILAHTDPMAVVISLITVGSLGFGGLRLLKAKRSGQVLVAVGSGVAILSILAVFGDGATGLSAVARHSHLLPSLVGLYGFPQLTLGGALLAAGTTLVLALSPATNRWLVANG